VARDEDLKRIEVALAVAADIVRAHESQATQREASVSRLERALDRALRDALLAPGEAWLSEESPDEPGRLAMRRVWIVDPVDGTRELRLGLPEWSISVGLVEDGRAVAGGVLSPSTARLFLGAPGSGVLLDGEPVELRSGPPTLKGARVLASRAEVERGEWQRFEQAAFSVEAMGSAALKLARVAAGLADATWTEVPKHEWDVAAGVALVEAAGGEARLIDGSRPRFNGPVPRLEGLVACRPGLLGDIFSVLGRRRPGQEVERP
jgi:myo-inositol-1(or 4)-monophosphatase